MTIKREQRKVERTPEEQARINAIRKKFQQNKPGPDQLAASEEYEAPVQASAYWEVRRIVAEFKAERERQGLTLAQLAERSGVDKGAISKLETGRQVNPTVDTLSRIAAGLGVSLSLTLHREEDQSRGEESGNQKSDKEAAAPQVDNISEPEARKALDYCLWAQARIAAHLAAGYKEPRRFLIEQAREHFSCCFDRMSNKGSRKTGRLPVIIPVATTHRDTDHGNLVLTRCVDGQLAFRLGFSDAGFETIVKRLSNLFQ